MLPMVLMERVSESAVSVASSLLSVRVILAPSADRAFPKDVRRDGETELLRSIVCWDIMSGGRKAGGRQEAGGGGRKSQDLGLELDGCLYVFRTAYGVSVVSPVTLGSICSPLRLVLCTPDL